MNLDRLHYFSVVAETGNLRRASEILKVSPPALSKAVKLLEAELGVKLVVQSGRGLLVTDRGKWLAPRARALVAEAERLRAQAATAASPTATPALRIGTFDVFSTYFLGPLLRALGPELPTTVHELSPGHLERALIDRHIDLGITYIPVPSPELEQVRVATIEMGVYAARSSELGGLALADVPFVVPVLPIAGSPDRVRGSDGWPESAPRRLVRYEVTLIESAMELARQGLAAIYVPKFIARLHNDRVREDLRLGEIFRDRPGRGASQPVYLLKRKADQEEAWFRRTARALRSECSRS